MVGGAVKQSRIFKWLNSLITCYSKPLISSVASTKLLHTHSAHKITKADSGATFHFLKPSHRKTMTNIVELTDGPKATLPNDHIIQASCEDIIPFAKLSKKSKKAFIYPDLSNESLLSIGQFCDDDCVAVFTKTRVYIVKNNELIVEGTRNLTDGLWDKKLPSSDTNIISPPTNNVKMNYIITKDKSNTGGEDFL